MMLKNTGLSWAETLKNTNRLHKASATHIKKAVPHLQHRPLLDIITVIYSRVICRATTETKGLYNTIRP